MPERRYYWGRNKRKSRVAISDFAFAYYSGMDLQEIAEPFGVDYRWLSKLLKRRGMPVRPKNFSRYDHIRYAWLVDPTIIKLRDRYDPSRSAPIQKGNSRGSDSRSLR